MIPRINNQQSKGDGIAPEELLKQNNQIRKQILEYLADALDNSEEGVANEREMITELDIDQRLIQINLDFLDICDFIDNHGSGSLSITSTGLQRLEIWRRLEQDQAMTLSEATKPEAIQQTTPQQIPQNSTCFY